MIVDDLLFLLLYQTSEIEWNELELVPFGFHFREISIYSGSVSVVEGISPVFFSRLFDSHFQAEFCLIPRLYLSFHIFWRPSQLSPRAICWDFYCCCSGRLNYSWSLFFCVSLVAVGVAGIFVFGRHCFYWGASWCPFVVLLAPLSESFLIFPSFLTHATFFAVPMFPYVRWSCLGESIFSLPLQSHNELECRCCYLR
jgi:hypothetical protein